MFNLHVFLNKQIVLKFVNSYNNTFQMTLECAFNAFFKTYFYFFPKSVFAV